MSMEDSYLAGCHCVESGSQFSGEVYLYINNNNNSLYSDEEDMMRDSLESIDANDGSLDCQTVEEEIKPAETMEEINGGINYSIHNYNIKESKNNYPEIEETQFIQKVKNSGSIKKKQPLKPHIKRDVVELNIMNVSKGRKKDSYSKMYEKRLQKKEQKMVKPKTEISEQPQERESDDVMSSHEGLTSGHLMHQLQSNENFHDNVVKNCSIRMDSNELEGNTKCSNSNDKQRNNQQSLIDHSHHTLSSDMVSRNESMVMNNLHKESYVGKDINTQLNLDDLSDGYHTRYLPPISEVLTSVRSAPADVETYHSDGYLQYEVPYRSSSVICTSKLPQDGKHPVKTTGYGSIYAKKYTYEPYTLSDYKILKQNATSSGGLGPDTNTKDFKEKMKKTARQKEYAAIIREKHSFDKSVWRKKAMSSPRDKNPKIKETNDRRKKALQYAKAVPKPIVTKRPISQVKAEVNPQQSFLDLLRQRHENEKKAIDAVRKDLEMKCRVK